MSLPGSGSPPSSHAWLGDAAWPRQGHIRFAQTFAFESVHPQSSAWKAAVAEDFHHGEFSHQGCLAHAPLSAIPQDSTDHHA